MSGSKLLFTLTFLSAGALAACAGDDAADDDALGTDTLTATPAPADTGMAGQMVMAHLSNAEGEEVGTATLTEADGGVRVAVQVSGLEPGPKGFHIHETGRCEPPAFQSAGSHFAPEGRQHGLENPQGPHAGDLPNLPVAEGGSVDTTFVVSGVTLRRGEPASLLDGDGSALVIHASADDNRTDPSGNSGDRIACGVIEAM